MKIITSQIFEKHNEIIFGMSTKQKLVENDMYNFNMSLNVEDNSERVLGNRNLFVSKLGLSIKNIATQKQIHSDIIKTTNCGGNVGKSDAIITSKKGIGIAISTADCCAIYLYDKEKKIIAGIHFGWRSTEKQILKKTLQLLKDKFNCNSKNLIAYIAPSISQKNYEIGSEVANKFQE